jgi:hypothetical protein
MSTTISSWSPMSEAIVKVELEGAVVKAMRDENGDSM